MRGRGSTGQPRRETPAPPAGGGGFLISAPAAHATLPPVHKPPLPRLTFRRQRCPGGPPEWATGKAVRNRRDPVTVIGDETHDGPWSGQSRTGKAWEVGRSESQ